jgi:hypothetical protein
MHSSTFYRVRHKSLNTPLRHKSVNTPLSPWWTIGQGDKGVLSDLCLTLYIVRAVTVHFQFLETWGGWSEETRRQRVSQWMRPVTVLWHDISVKNTSSKYIGRYAIRSQQSHSNKNDKLFCTRLVAESHTFVRRLPILSCLHSLNTFHVCNY